MLDQAFLTQDFPLFTRSFLKIRTKERGIQPFVLWPHQEQMWWDRADLITQGRPLWRFYLKYRQGGFSRYFLAEDLFFALTHPNTNVLIVAHKKKLPTQFLKDIKGFIASMPVWCRPELTEDTATSIQFTDEFGGSRITIASANTAMEGGGLEVGETYQRIHVSEASDPVFKKDPLNEMFQTAPPNSEVIVESTAKGIGNWHNETYWAAVKDESKFTAYFVPWTVHEEYTLPVPMDFRPDEEELALMKDYGLTAEQVVWRDDKIKKEMRDARKFKEQYPITDTEAFLFTGNSFFSQPDLAHFLEDPYFCKDFPAIRGTLTKDGDGKWLLNKHAAGQLTVFAPPAKGKTYVIGADVADGLEGGDYSVASVWCGQNMEQVAEFHGHISPYDFATELDHLGQWYNNALLAVEDNNMGSTTITRLYRDVFYPNLYFRERTSTVEDSSTFKRAGWHTSAPNKREIVAAMAHQVENWEKTGFTPHGKEFVDECRTFAAHTDKVGMARYAAQSGCQDDRVMAACIALRAMASWQYSTDAVVTEPTDQWRIEEDEYEPSADTGWMISG